MGGAGWGKQYKLTLEMQEVSGRDKRNFGGCGCSSVVEGLPIMHEALDLILSITKSNSKFGLSIMLSLSLVWLRMTSRTSDAGVP